MTTSQGRPERVGLIAEGHGDLAVLKNILKGALGLDFGDGVLPLRPEYSRDETDLQDAAARGSYLYVIDDCKHRLARHAARLSQLTDNWLLVIHLDSAEAHRAEYELGPVDAKKRADINAIGPLLVDKLRSWAGTQCGAGRLSFAIAVQEIEAWLLAIHDEEETRDTGRHRSPKEHLHHAVLPHKLKKQEKSRLYQLSEFDRYDSLSQPLRKKKTLDQAARRNASLRAFCAGLDALAG